MVDYLLEPIAYERFLKEIEKFKASHPVKPQNGVYRFKERQTHLKIPLGDILFVSGAGDYIHIHTRKKKYLVFQTMHALEQKYALHGFIRKSYIINMYNIGRHTVSEILIE